MGLIYVVTRCSVSRVMLPSSKRDPYDLLPLTAAVFHVLVALADGDLHGYAVIKDVSTRTGGRVVLGTGTLYGIVKRLLADGLVVESKRRPAAAIDDERRRYYRLTPFGRGVVTAETARLEAMVAAARSTLTLRKESA
jgi:DNA-binding PadR family transcriptional regulator